MTQNESESLVALEHLMEEFFDHRTNNGRKHEIETQLSNFSNQRDAWKYCIYFVTNSSSQYVSMYALSTIEAVINRQWATLEWEHRVELKNALYTFLVEQDPTAPHFLKNKLSKLLVDIARHDWPHFYPEFFTNIIELLQSERGRLLGLILLRTTSEELTCQRPDLNTNRKEELTRLLQHHIPQVFQILTTILDSLGSKPRHATTATPPPSPTHPSSAPSLAEQLTVAAFRPDSKSITREILATLQHLFTWANLNHVPLQIIKAIFNFTHISSYAQDDDDMCVLAMSTLNELLYRKCIPPGSQNLFLELYHNTVQLLRDVTCPAAGRIETLGPDFIEKLSELLALLMEQHLWRLEGEPRFSALDFLSLLYQLTMQLPSTHCYLRCLSVWASFIKQIKPQNAHKYSEALLGLVTSVLNKMQFSFNYAQLEETDNENEDDDNETEWQIFLKTSIEIVAMVAEYAPTPTFNQVLMPWKAANDVYSMLVNVVDERTSSLKLEYSETQRLHCILRDLSSLTQTLARLSTFFIDQDNDCSKSAAPVVDSLVGKLIQSASLATNIRFYHLKMCDSKLINDFADVHSQLLAGLKTWSIWFSQNEDLNNSNLQQLIDLSLPILRLGNSEPPKVCHAAAHLLLSLSGNAFPPSLMSLPSVVEFLHIAPNIRFNNKQTNEVVNNAFCNILIRPWGDLSIADANKRQCLINTFFEAISKEFRELTPSADENKVREVVSSTLTTVSNIIDYSKNYPSTSKKLLYNGLKPSIEHALVLFPSYAKYPETSDQILVLFLNVLGVLQQQIGVDGTKHAVEVFLEVAVSDQQTKNMSGLDKLLKILQLVVEAPNPSYKSFLPGILQLCMQNVYPLVICQANEHPDVIIALLTLLYSILLHRWNYFYISQVRLGHSPGCSETEPIPDSPQQPSQLLAVLQVFGQSLLQPDINTFRTSLAAIEDLNTKWKLYHKALFREQLLSQFLTVLIHTLLDKTHHLLADDILLAIFNMAAVNFHSFFSTFLAQFLQNTEGLTPTQRETLQMAFRHDTDTPTFVQNVQRFINDMRCYRLCNASLPPGSIVL